MILLGVCGEFSVISMMETDVPYLSGRYQTAMSSYYYHWAFDDLGMHQKQFTGLVRSVCSILEDILAIAVMVMLSDSRSAITSESTQRRCWGSITKP